MNIHLKEALEIVCAHLRTDEGYRLSWQANIAMPFQDEWQRMAESGGLPCKPEHIHEISNKAATYFLSLLCSEGGQYKQLKNLFETGSHPVKEKE